jgi:hypothetical protein
MAMRGFISGYFLTLSMRWRVNVAVATITGSNAPIGNFYQRLPEERLDSEGVGT